MIKKRGTTVQYTSGFVGQKLEHSSIIPNQMEKSTRHEVESVHLWVIGIM